MDMSRKLILWFSASSIVNCSPDKKGDCEKRLQNNSGYIGHTTTTLSRRITMHLQQGSILTHNDTHHHHDRLTRADITNNITVLQQEFNDSKRSFFVVG